MLDSLHCLFRFTQDAPCPAKVVIVKDDLNKASWFSAWLGLTNRKHRQEAGGPVNGGEGTSSPVGFLCWCCLVMAPFPYGMPEFREAGSLHSFLSQEFHELFLSHHFPSPSLADPLIFLLIQ